MMSQTQRAGHQRDDGFIIVAVLWMLGALATLAVVYSLYVKETTAAFLDHNERLQGEALAISGVELAVYRLTEVPDKRPPLGRFSFRQGSAVVNVAFGAENGRIDLNFAPKEILAGLFTGLGASQQAALYFADRIVGWRTPLAANTQDTEAAIYQSAGKAYGPRHGPFQSVDEVALVVGLPPQFIDRALPYLTVYSGQTGINVMSAPAAVIAALPGITPDRVQLLVGERDLAMAQDNPMSQDAIRSQLASAANYVSLQPSAANRITVDMRFPSGRRMRAQAVVMVVDKDTEPYRVLSWRDAELSGDAGAGAADWQ